MNVLLIGAGVIGSVYGGQVALAGHSLWVLAHGPREQQLTRQGIRLHDVEKDAHDTITVKLSARPDDREYDLVLVAVQAEQLPSTFPALRTLKGRPHIIFLGNNPEGRAILPHDIPGTIELAFPGIGGSARDGVIDYLQISQQPTTLETNPPEASRALQAALESRGFRVQRTAHIDGWLAYHAVFISCLSMALLKVDIHPASLGNDPKQLRLMCRAIEEGFGALKSQHIPGLPRNLGLLHHPLLRPVAMRYWGSILRSPKGELYFGAHLRHAPAETQALARWVLERVAQGRSNTDNLRRLIKK